MSNVLYVKDGDNLSIIVKLDPSVSDPALFVPAIAQTYRVVANSFAPILKLVPLADKPTLLTELPENIGDR
jgi:hypothetical protein